MLREAFTAHGCVGQSVLKPEQPRRKGSQFSGCLFCRGVPAAARILRIDQYIRCVQRTAASRPYDVLSNDDKLKLQCSI